MPNIFATFNPSFKPLIRDPNNPYLIRRKEIAALLKEGLTLKEIAEYLGLSVRVVKRYL